MPYDSARSDFDVCVHHGEGSHTGIQGRDGSQVIEGREDRHICMM